MAGWCRRGGGRDRHQLPDALAAAPLAARRGAPVLLTVGDGAALVRQLDGLGARRATLVGGTAAIDDGQVAALRAAGVDVDRLAGPDRYATAAALSSGWSAGSADWDGTVWLASGTSSADALAAGAAAARAGAPLLLTDPQVLPAATRAELERLRPSRVLLVGGAAAVSSDVAGELTEIAPVRRVAGPDRWATAVDVARTGWSNSPDDPLERGLGHDRAMLAEGVGFADAVAGAPLAAGGWGPVLLTTRDELPTATRTALAEAVGRDGLTGVTVLGGPAALSNRVAGDVEDLLLRP